MLLSTKWPHTHSPHTGAQGTNSHGNTKDWHRTLPTTWRRPLLGGDRKRLSTYSYSEFRSSCIKPSLSSDERRCALDDVTTLLSC